MPTPIKMRTIGLTILTLMVLTACGQKRALYLPEEPESNSESQNPVTSNETLKQGK